MGFLGYCAIIWLCFPLWPYMYAGCGGGQRTDCLSELVLLVCIVWLPGVPASYCCLHLPRGNEMRERFSVTTKRKAAPQFILKNRKGQRLFLSACGTGFRSRSAAVGSPCRGMCILQASRCSFCGTVPGLTAACRSLKHLNKCRKAIAVA